MKATLAFYKAEGLLFDKLIRWWTKSNYSHTELVINGQSYSATERKGEGGARVKSIAFNPKHWDFIGFAAMYLYYLFTVGYYANPFEIEARGVENGL